MIQGSLLQLWMHKCSKQQTNLQLLSTEKNLLMWMDEQPNWLGLVLHGEEDQQQSTGEVCWKY